MSRSHQFATGLDEPTAHDGPRTRSYAQETQAERPDRRLEAAAEHDRQLLSYAAPRAHTIDGSRARARQLAWPGASTRSPTNTVAGFARSRLQVAPIGTSLSKQPARRQAGRQTGRSHQSDTRSRGRCARGGRAAEQPGSAYMIRCVISALRVFAPSDRKRQRRRYAHAKFI